MKKKLGMILLAATMLGAVATTSGYGPPVCYHVGGGLYICDY